MKRMSAEVVILKKEVANKQRELARLSCEVENQEVSVPIHFSHLEMVRTFLGELEKIGFSTRLENVGRLKEGVFIPAGVEGKARRSHRTKGTKKNGFHGIISLYKRQRFSAIPEKPIGESFYTTSQMIDAFAISTNVVSGGGNASPYVEAAANAITYFAAAFSIQDLGQVSQLTAVFDQYRFEKIELKFVPQTNAVNTMNTASPNNSVPQLFVVLDFDDSTALASLAAVLQYDNVEVAMYGEGLHLVVHPSNTTALYASGAFSGYQVQKPQWTDCANTAVAHYGIKGAVTGTPVTSTSTVLWNVFAKYYVSFKNTR